MPVEGLPGITVGWGGGGASKGDWGECQIF